jgi:hypothetical protein
VLAYLRFSGSLRCGQRWCLTPHVEHPQLFLQLTLDWFPAAACLPASCVLSLQPGAFNFGGAPAAGQPQGGAFNFQG